MVMFAVMTLLGHDATWPVCQKVLADPEFMKHLFEFDKDNIPQKKLTAIERYTKKENFAPEYIKSKSLAAGVLCLWVRSMEDYSKALKIVRPKRQKKEFAEAELARRLEELRLMQEEYKHLLNQIKEL